MMKISKKKYKRLKKRISALERTIQRRTNPNKMLGKQN